MASAAVMDASNQSYLEEARDTQQLLGILTTLRGLPLGTIRSTLENLHARQQEGAQNPDSLQHEFSQIEGGLENIGAVYAQALGYKKRCGDVTNQIKSAIADAQKSLGIGVPEASWTDENRERFTVFQYMRRINILRSRNAEAGGQTECQLPYHKGKLFGAGKIGTCPSCNRGMCAQCATKIDKMEFKLCHFCLEGFRTLEKRVSLIDEHSVQFYVKLFETHVDNLEALKKSEAIVLKVIARYQQMQALMGEIEEIQQSASQFKSQCKDLKHAMNPYRTEELTIGVGAGIVGAGVALKASGVGVVLHSTLIGVAPAVFSGPLLPWVAGTGAVIGGAGFAVKKFRETNMARRVATQFFWWLFSS